MKTLEQLVDALADVDLPMVFNPYRHACAIHDNADSPVQRRRNLLNYLTAARRAGAKTMWMGRDLGYRGGRRTGLPLTDEAHLSSFAVRYPGSDPKKATVSSTVAERTAAEIWSRIRAVAEPPLLWNVFPFHPHSDESEFDNRRFRARELEKVHHINLALVEIMGIQRIVAIGRDAEHYGSSIGINVHRIRHPSYGGIRDFRSGLAKLYPETKSFGQAVLPGMESQSV